MSDISDYVLREEPDPTTGEYREARGTGFDELYVGTERPWLGMERMTERTWWMSLGDAYIYVTILDDGRASLNILRDTNYPQVKAPEQTEEDDAI